MGLMTSSTFHTDPSGDIQVILKQRSVVGMNTAINDVLGTITRAKAAEICQSLFGNNDIKIVLSLVNMRGHRDDAGDSMRIPFGGSG
jgi:hypothetical protein